MHQVFYFHGLLLDKYDIYVVPSEVIELVDNQELFLEKCSDVLKPSGSIFLTTENKTFLSWLVMILGAEYVLGLLPRGTHQLRLSGADTDRTLRGVLCGRRHGGRFEWCGT